MKGLEEYMGDIRITSDASELPSASERLSSSVRLRRVGLVVGLVLAAFGLIGATPGPTRVTHASGIEILPPIGMPVIPEVQRQAAREALALMHDNPDGFGWPFIDGTGNLVLSVARPSADALARSWAPRDQAAKTVARRTRAVAYSMTQLEAIADDLTRIVRQKSGLPDLDLVYQWGPDVESNKIAIQIDRASDPLLFALAARYDTRAVAVRVERNPGWHLVSRNSDSAPFWGGALILHYPQMNFGCTDAFSMDIPSGYGMLTAGHCWPTQSTPGTVTTPVATIGTVYLGETNYSTTTGTVVLPGQSQTRGDIALIRVTDPRGAQGYIYRGGVDSSSFGPVKGWWGWATIGDQFCAGGTSTGEQCGWTVYNLRQRHFDAGLIVEPLTDGKRDWWNGGCLLGGDSGGPAYTVREPDGGVFAKGVLNLAGGCDAAQTRTVAITEIQDALAALPGASVKTVP
jgi:hypothetical protein